MNCRARDRWPHGGKWIEVDNAQSQVLIMRVILVRNDSYIGEVEFVLGLR